MRGIHGDLIVAEVGHKKYLRGNKGVIKLGTVGGQPEIGLYMATGLIVALNMVFAYENYLFQPVWAWKNDLLVAIQFLT